MKFISAIVLLLLLGKTSGFSQGFVNLNFESANVSGYSANSFNVPTSDALPSWTAFYSSGTSTNVATQVWYDAISGGGAIISINDTNTGFGFSPLQGKYSAFLFGGPYNSPTLYSVGISQTAFVPNGIESLRIDAVDYGAAFVVSLGGETIDMIPLQTFSNYTLYGGDISSFAGQVETLSLIEPPSPTVAPTEFELDNIQFSTSPVPEPGQFALAALGAALFAFRRRRKSAT